MPQTSTAVAQIAFKRLRKFWSRFSMICAQIRWNKKAQKWNKKARNGVMFPDFGVMFSGVVSHCFGARRVERKWWKCFRNITTITLECNAVDDMRAYEQI